MARLYLKNLLERYDVPPVFGVVDEVADDVDEVVLPRKGTGYDAEGIPFVTFEEAEHRLGLLLYRRRQLQNRRLAIWLLQYEHKET